MSIEVVSWALNSVTNITATQKAVLIALADRADVNGFCYPSYEDICKRSCATRNTVSMALKHFESIGIIRKHRRYSKSTVYQMIISNTKIDTIDSSIKIDTISSMKIDTTSSTDIRTLTVIEPSKEPSWVGRFKEFWEKYPRKSAKQQAEKAFKRLNKKDQVAAIKGLQSFEFSNEKHFIPYASTFINQRRWEDEQETTTTKSTGFEI